MARQFRWSVGGGFICSHITDGNSPDAATSGGSMYYGAQVIDVKDAFLMVPQPEEERASVTCKGTRCKLVRCLPGCSQL